MPSATLVIVAQPIEQVLGEVSGLTVVYGATTALGGVDLQIRAGEFVAIMGRSGSGKSTLLHCLAGLQTPTSGEVFLVGQALTGLGRTALAKHRRAATALVFQSYNLVPFLSVVDNVALPGAISGHGWNRTAALAALGDVGLTDLARSKPAALPATRPVKRCQAVARTRCPWSACLSSRERTSASIGGASIRPASSGKMTRRAFLAWAARRKRRCNSRSSSSVRGRRSRCCTLATT